jgi:hypothetical protein
MTYLDQLKDPLWQRKRTDILNRDNFTCQKCGNDKDTLHVHHRHYINGRRPWDYPDQLLITLCYKCHKEEENCVQDASSVFEALHVLGMFNTEIRDELNNIVNRQISKLSKNNPNG